MLPSLGLFGGVAWRSHGREHRLPTGRPTSVAVLLAEHQPRPLSGDDILDRLWDDPPRSGVNAVQRHVSALRRGLRAAGCSPNAIETLQSGYRLHPEVRTDLAELDTLIDGDPRGGHPDTSGDVRWWLEPVPDVPWEPHVLFRRVLARRAVEVARHWGDRARADGRLDEAVAILQSMTALYPEDEKLWSVYMDVLVGTGDRQLVAAAHRRDASATISLEPPAAAGGPMFPPPLVVGGEPASSRQLTDLDACVSRWFSDDGDGAFEELERVGDRLDRDLARRVARSLVWTAPEDRYAGLLWRHVVGLASLAPARAEQVLVSLDAHALEQMHDGLVVGDEEVASSRTVDELVRSLRVRFLVGLGHPVDDRQRETVDRLASMGHGLAQAEARRFGAVLDLKRGRLADALRQLDEYEAVARRVLPTTQGDVAQVARTVLAAAESAVTVTRGTTSLVAPPLVAPLLVAQLALDVSALWPRLVGGDAPSDPEVLRLHHAVRSIAPGHLGRALGALRQVRLRGLADAASEVEALVSSPSTGARDVQAAGAALAVIALTNQQEGLARAAFDLLEPWADEHVGVWPHDLVIGPAGRHLERLGSMLG